MTLYALNLWTWLLVDDAWNYFSQHPLEHQFASKDDLVSACAELQEVNETLENSTLCRIDINKPFSRGNLRIVNVELEVQEDHLHV
jgi:hypothetical protein